MLHKCANPACENPFRRLTQGKLFLVDRRPANTEDNPYGRRQGQSQLEYYWLCDQCMLHFTLAHEPGRGILAVPVVDISKKGQGIEIEPGSEHAGQDQYARRA
jgi:hypothetical protein